MIISASRRTDIPAFYSDWFFNRIRQGFVIIRNPMNYNQLSRVSLATEVVDCIVFWTKDPMRMLDRIDELESYNFYFQFTLTPYEKDIEPQLRDKNDLIETFKRLSEKIGRHRVIWRYDPILLTDKYDIMYHLESFRRMMVSLHKHTDKCVISFLDMYKSINKNMNNLGVKVLTHNEMIELGSGISSIASDYGVTVTTCSEQIDLSSFGIDHNRCIDDKLIKEIAGTYISVEKDKNQRETCGCVSSIDIGMYNSCLYNCKYCYANHNPKTIRKNFVSHDSSSPIILGNISGEEKITERKMVSLIDKQQIFL